MLEARFVPIDKWPIEPTKSRKGSPFYVHYNNTLDDLEEELRKLKAKDILVQSFFTYDQLRNDGWPRAGESPHHPGIILTFTTPQGTLSFPCDRYNNFQANIRAIGLSLAALRAIDRYGVTRRAEQYQGWRQIAPQSDKPFSTKEDAAAFVAAQAYGSTTDGPRIISDINYRNIAYKAAAARVHPDAKNGSHDLFVNLRAAMDLLEA